MEVGCSTAYAPIDIKVELIERLGSEMMVVFPVETPTIRSDQFGSQAGADDDDLLAGRSARLAPFTARLEGNTNLEIGQSARLGVRVDAMHFFNRKTGIAL